MVFTCVLMYTVKTVCSGRCRTSWVCHAGRWAERPPIVSTICSICYTSGAIFRSCHLKNVTAHPAMSRMTYCNVMPAGCGVKVPIVSSCNSCCSCCGNGPRPARSAVAAAIWWATCIWTSGCAADRLLSVGQAFQIEIVVAKTGGLHKAFTTAAVVTGALELVGQYAATLGLFHQRIGNLDFTAFAGFGFFNQLEDVGGQDVAADDCQAGRGVFGFWLFDHGVNAKNVIPDDFTCNHTILVNLFGWHFLHRHD